MSEQNFAALDTAGARTDPGSCEPGNNGGRTPEVAVVGMRYGETGGADLIQTALLPTFV